MKFAVLTLTLLCIFSLQSCKKNDKEHKTKYITINATLASGEKYSLNLKQYGDDDDVATITKQAIGNFSVSSIDNNFLANNATYQYASNPKFTANDDVEITVTEGKHNNDNRGQHCNETEAVITIHFTIK